MTHFILALNRVYETGMCNDASMVKDGSEARLRQNKFARGKILVQITDAKKPARPKRCRQVAVYNRSHSA